MKLSSLSSPGGGDSSLTGRLADRRSADSPRCCAASRAAAVPTSNGLCASSMATSGLDLHASTRDSGALTVHGLAYATGMCQMRRELGESWRFSTCRRQVLSWWLMPQGQGPASHMETSPPLTVTHVACVAGGEAVGVVVPSCSVATACRSCGGAACCAGLRRRTCAVTTQTSSQLRFAMCCIKHSCTKEAFVCGLPR
jgi:hypothetical protein